MSTGSLRLLFRTLIVSSLSISFATQAFADAKWLTDIKSALELATKEKKDLLFDFTGSDWCGWCIRLRKEVFDTPEFQKDAPTDFIFVELDFPRDASKIPAETKKQNQEWLEKLGVQGFPTIFLVDAAGVPYAQTGYQPGGPTKYLAHLKELRGVRLKRDEAMAKAAKAEGAEKAQALDGALEAVGESLALASYSDRVKEIIALDKDGKAGLRTKYEDKLNLSEVRKLIAEAQGSLNGGNAAEILTTLEEKIGTLAKAGMAKVEFSLFKADILSSQGKEADALVLLDEVLKEKGLKGETLVRASMQKVGILKQQEKHEDVVKALDALVANESIEGNVRVMLRAERAVALADGGKLALALEAFDAIIASEKEPDLKVRLYFGKAQVLLKADRKDDAGKALDAAIEVATTTEMKDQLREIKSNILQPDTPPGEGDAEPQEESEP